VAAVCGQTAAAAGTTETADGAAAHNGALSALVAPWVAVADIGNVSVAWYAAAAAAALATAVAAATGTSTVRHGRGSVPTGRKTRVRFPFGFPAVFAVAGATGF